MQNGATASAVGVVGQAFSFDGVDDYMSTSLNNLPLTDLTIDFWANTDSGNTGRLFGYENALYGSYGLAMYFPGPNTSTPYLIMRKGESYYDMSWGTIVPGTWNHYTATISSTAGTKTYLNGVLVSSNANATSYSYAPGVTFKIGSAGYGGYYYKGLVDEFKIFNTAVDTIASVGSITINSNAPSTNSTSTTLNLSATDAVGVTGYFVSEVPATPTISTPGWVAVTSTTNYNANASYTFSNNINGIKTVYVWFKDAVGNISSITSDAITLDTIAPVIAITSPINGTLTNQTNIAVAWSIDGVNQTTQLTEALATEGSNTITRSATDAAGNPGTASVTVTRDTIAPLSQLSQAHL